MWPVFSPSMSSANRYWQSPPVPAPIDTMNSEVRRLISAAISAGTTSISAPKAPASSSALVARYTAIALSAVLPTALKPPVQVLRDGISPTWLMTGRCPRPAGEWSAGRR